MSEDLSLTVKVFFRFVHHKSCASLSFKIPVNTVETMTVSLNFYFSYATTQSVKLFIYLLQFEKSRRKHSGFLFPHLHSPFLLLSLQEFYFHVHHSVKKMLFRLLCLHLETRLYNSRCRIHLQSRTLLCFCPCYHSLAPSSSLQLAISVISLPQETLHGQKSHGLQCSFPLIEEFFTIAF